MRKWFPCGGPLVCEALGVEAEWQARGGVQAGGARASPGARLLSEPLAGRAENSGALEHRADALFVLPELPATALVAGELPGWEKDLVERGIELVHEAPDLTVATEATLDAALASGARFVVVDGGRAAGARLRRAGFSVERLLPLPMQGTPVLYVNLDQPRAAGYGVRHGIVHPERWRAVRNRAAAAVIAAGVSRPFGTLVSVGSREPGPPQLVAAATELGAPRGADWVMLVSAGSVVRRNALLLFPGGRGRPEYVLKFSRVPGLTEQFERDERAAELVERAGPVVAEHAPRYLGRCEVADRHLSVETAAVGTKLAYVLRDPGTRARRAGVLESIAQWLIRVARETAAPPPALQPELDRLAGEVLPFWSWSGVDPNLAAKLPPVPASFQHNDMAEENLVIEGDQFMGLDWEWVQPHGIPLGDLVYYAVHVLRLLDGRLSEEERDRHFAELVTGRAPSSPTFMRWVRELSHAAGIPEEAVGPLVTLSWLDRGRLSKQERLKAEAVSGTRLGEAYAERCARTWITHPALGPGWDLWRRADGK
jgi:hypothetical protein